MIILPILPTSLTHFFLKGQNVLFETLGEKRLKRCWIKKIQGIATPIKLA